MIIENGKKLIVFIIGLGSLAGAITGILALHNSIMSKIREDRHKENIEFLHREATPLITKQINITLDSIKKAKTISFRQGLAAEIGINYDEVIPKFAQHFINSENTQNIGLKRDKALNQLFYIHTDGKRYRTFKDTSGNYFFYNSDGVKESPK